MTHARVALTMIVKNESHVIARCVDAVKHLVDCFAIVDTGSSDSTEEAARAALHGLPGAFIRDTSPWQGYARARNKSLNLAEKVGANVALIVDADDVWRGERPVLGDEEGYSVWAVQQSARWSTTRYIRLHKAAHYVGAVHEMPVDQGGKPLVAPLLEGVTVTSPNDGASWSDPEKYLQHARAISAELVEDPTNTRNAFYLAQSYRDHRDDRRAASLYLARAAMGPGGHPEEVYVSFLEAGRAFMRLGQVSEARRALLQAHQAFPGRREAMVELTKVFAHLAATSPTVGTLFVEQYPELEAE